ncbi:MAG: hypothetical protein CMP54_02510 [Flavobacteriales bacterium]|nr:hypothetical protein [Flavobacteriales bacterium]
MNLSIEKHVFELLKYHDCIIITGFGGFILNNRNAYINHVNHKIYPPSKKIGFNKNLCENDGLLANYVSQVENISYDEACIEILKFSRKANLRLEKGASIVFENVGEISYDSNNSIVFKPTGMFNFDAQSYGMKEFQINEQEKKEIKITQNNLSIAAAIILLLCISIVSLTTKDLKQVLTFNLSPLKTNNYTPRTPAVDIDSLGRETPGIYNVQVSKIDPDLYKINGTNYHISTKRCFKEGFARDVQIKIWIDEKERIKREVCFLNASETEYDDCYRITDVYNAITSNSKKIMVLMKNGKMKEALLVLEETYIDPYVIANTIPEEDFNVSNEDTLAIKDIPSRFMDAIQSVSSYEKNKKKIIKIDKNEAPQKLEKVNNQNIHIIVGSFSDKKNAQALTKQMNNRGFKNARIIGTNTTGLIRVAVASFYTEEEAQKSILEIKKQLSSVWILNEID